MIMGLDMFLFRVKDDDKVDELFYWRKAYPIMDWFEEHYDGIGNLEDYPVDKEDLTALREFCINIIAEGNFHEMDSFKSIEWTSEYELKEWSDYHMDYVKSTKSFLDGFLKDNEDWENIIFKAWW